ncbi:hypothetical protein JDS79_43215 [Bacillus cereus]|nr:hypothetical protein [Bacillus cereus]
MAFENDKACDKILEKMLSTLILLFWIYLTFADDGGQMSAQHPKTGKRYQISDGIQSKADTR